jgi:hypothetical protein
MTTPIRSLISGAVAGLLLAGCYPTSEAALDATAQPLDVQNGLTLNGLTENGLSANGLSANGLSANGLSANGLSTSQFSTWFNKNTSLSSAVMTYVYRCAAPLGTSITWTNKATGQSYTWYGLLGVATAWASGQKITTAEKQTVTACLAAHVNKYGVHIAIAVEGRTATGQQIPILPGELDLFSVKEACFFGDLFSGDGVFVGVDHAQLGGAFTTARACALDSATAGPSTECPPMYFAGDCAKICTLDPTKTYYTSCTWNRKSYKPVNTRMLPSDVYRCGDGTCQFTEACNLPTACKSDCGCK